MTKEEIIMRAKQLGFPRLSKNSHDNQATMIATIVEEAVLLEREACAKDCEEIDSSSDYYGERVELICAEVIRARRDVVTYGEPTSRGEA